MLATTVIEASRTSECTSGANLGDRGIQKVDGLRTHYFDDLYHMLDILLSYWGCGKFFIQRSMHIIHTIV